jgi:hypothetical protein
MALDDFFQTIECQDWEQFIEQLERHEAGWLFRGVRNAEWTLQPSLERHAPADRKRSGSEQMLLEEFKRRAHLHLGAHHVPADDIEWLALLQHWGGPTRLLDFTASPYVAAYFAVEDADAAKEPLCAVWAVDKYSIWRCSGAVLVPDPKGVDPDKFHRVVGYSMGREPSWFSERVLKNTHTCVIEVVPGRFSERVSLQQGVFLCPVNVDASFMENLSATGLHRTSLKKLTFPTRFRGRALERLRAMNITRATLFPGLEGLAQSFRQLLIDEPSEEKKARLEMRYVLDGLHYATEGRVADAEEN